MSADSIPSDIEAQYQQYRTLSFSAIVAMTLGLVSLPVAYIANVSPGFLLIPMIGMIVGATSVLKLRHQTDEFTGLGAAKIGLLLSTVLFFGGATWFAYCYVTEVPDGYRRTSFGELQPDPRYPQFPFPPKAAELNDAKVFIQGYVYPDDQQGDIKRFVLVPDFGACCFGGQPKLTDMIQVTLQDPLRVNYSYTRRNLGGRFFVANASAKKVGNVVYQLDADYLK
jgi:hypothetical protein